MIRDTAKGKAEDVQAEFNTLRVLVDAVDSKVAFFITEKSVFGPYAHTMSLSSPLPWISKPCFPLSTKRSGRWKRTRISWCTYWRKRCGVGKLIDLTGQRFGRLVVLERAENKGSKVQWLCKCDCGGSIIVRSYQLKNGGTKSCGCLHRENTEILNRRKLSQTDGRSKTRIYRVWIGMRSRCNNPNNYDFKDYGGRGIKVCEEWEISFEAFRTWANSHGYQENLTIDRIDVNGNYCPENCRWVSWAVQHRNQRVSHMLSCHGERKTVADWSKITGISHSTLLARIKSGWTDEEVLTTPVRKRKKHNK